jgi:hypothetical protein
MRSADREALQQPEGLKAEFGKDGLTDEHLAKQLLNTGGNLVRYP